MNETVQRAALRINEAAQALGLSRSTIYNLLAANELRAVRIAGRPLIPVSELNRLLAGKAESHASDDAKPSLAASEAAGSQ